MKKFYSWFTLFFIVYITSMYIYLFTIDTVLPQKYVHTVADPTTFMSPEQLNKATIFSRVKYFLFFIGVPWEWAVYLLVLGLGFSSSFYLIAKKVNNRSLIIQSIIYVFLLNLFVAIFKFPLQYYSYKISRDYGINIQPFDLWVSDKLKAFLVDLIIMAPIVWIFYSIIKKSAKKWWFWFWLISIPLTILMFFLQPVIIDPIFNDFQTLQDQELKNEILMIARKASIPTDQVYQVNMSEKTKAMNAYVTGIGSNTRIVLWDTTLQKLNKNEVLFIMAHEIGHYVYHHIYWLLLGTIISSLILLYLIYKLINLLVAKIGPFWGIKNVGDINSLPIFLLLFSVLSFLVSPIENTVSRYSERSADAYAIRMTNDKESAITSFQKLTVESLTEPNPPKIVKVFLYSHPTMTERLYTLYGE